MLQTCLNCDHHFKGNYCPNCGQKIISKRITASVLLEDVVHFLTHLEKGFLYTTWNFLAKPGQISLNYLEGKRKKCQKPVSYFLIWAGLYILAHNFIINHFHYKLFDLNLAAPDLSEQANILLRTHFLLLLSFPFCLSARF